jgi:hypothetical protein
MAKPIEATPTLEGKDAERFLSKMVHTEQRSITLPERVTAKKVINFNVEGIDWAEFDQEIINENQKLENWMIQNFGPRCPDFTKGCIVCEKWKLYDKLKMEI